uniref:Facilitated trehalose transporter Tret1 n=2 Tax=Lygus hesperus TaxID=30085 RepID=A0A0A9WX56_LYGHE
MGKTRTPVSWESPREASAEEVAVNHGLAKQCFAAFVVSLTTFNCGLSTVWISPTSVELTAGANIVGRFEEDEISIKILTSHYASVLSALLMGLTANSYGRKPALYLAAIINIIGGEILRNAEDSTSIWAGNACASCTIVSGLVVGPMLLSEIAHQRVRGALITFCALQFNFGMLAAYSLYPFFSKNVFQIIYIIIPAAQLILYIFIPESPYFLVSKSRTLEAEGSLFWSRGSNRPIAKGELAILVRSSLTQHRSVLQVIKSRATRRGFLTSTGLVFFQRTTGFLVFCCYSNMIVQNSGNILNDRDTGIVFAGIQIAASLISLTLVDLIGRKALLYISYGGNFVSLSVLTIYFLSLKTDVNLARVDWLPLVCMMCFTVSYNLGAGSLTTVMPNEVTPIRTKGIIASIDGILNSILLLVVVGYNPVLERHLGIYVNFLIPSIISAIALVFTWVIVPETRGKSLLDYSEELDVKPRDAEPLKNEVTYL